MLVIYFRCVDYYLPKVLAMCCVWICLVCGTVLCITEDGAKYIVQTSEGEKVVSLIDCECIFRKSMLLPCRHMIALRMKLGEPIFDASICEERWTAAYYRSTQRLSSNCSSRASLSVIESSTEKRPLSQHEKYRKAVLLTSELASVASGASQFHFVQRLNLIQELIDHWKCGKEVGLLDLNEGECKCHILGYFVTMQYCIVDFSLAVN